jgi:hypothetical protein
MLTDVSEVPNSSFMRAMMEAVSSDETSVNINQITRRNIQEVCSFCTCLRGDLESHMEQCVYPEHCCLTANPYGVRTKKATWTSSPRWEPHISQPNACMKLKLFHFHEKWRNLTKVQSTNKLSKLLSQQISKVWPLDFESLWIKKTD